MYNQEKTISANSRGIIVSYTDANKHMFMSYETPKHVQKIQIQGTRRYQEIDSQAFNEVQKYLYSSVVYGFRAFDKQEIDQMSKSKKLRIKILYTKANRILNRWKQEVVNESLDSLLTKLFPKSPVIKQLCSVKGYDDNVYCEISFKELGINKHQIANKLIEYGLLPKNFYQLT